MADSSPWSTTGEIEFVSDGMVDWRNAQGAQRNALKACAPAYSEARIAGGRFAWAVWSTLSAANRGEEPAAHGIAKTKAERDAGVSRAVDAALQRPGAMQPAVPLPAKVVLDWRRKLWTQRRVARSPQTTEAVLVGYVYRHWCTRDSSAAPCPPPPVDGGYAASEQWQARHDRWWASLPLVWHYEQHRITKRTVHRIFALREPGPGAVGRDFGGVPLDECFAFERASMERGGAVERAWRGTLADSSGRCWFSLSEEPPALGCVRAGSAPACIKALGLTWPCALADVRRAYRQRAREVHPDHGGTEAAFNRLRTHYETAVRAVEARET